MKIKKTVKYYNSMCLRKILNSLVVLSLLVGFSGVKAQKLISFDDVITKGTFRAKSVAGLRSMNDGVHYSTMEDHGKIIAKYSYKSGQRVSTIFDFNSLGVDSIKGFSSYSFSSDESKILLMTDVESIYRHSFTANYYIYNFVTKEFTALSEGGKQQVATFSPDGTRVAFVRDNNLYVRSLLFDTETRATDDGKFNSILNGIPDWVYEEEFGFSRAFEWSPDSKQIAYIKFDESEVRTFGIPMYSGSNPSYEENALYPTEYRFKYPKAGESNSVVSVHVYDLKNRQSIEMDSGDNLDVYIPRVRWTHSGSDLAILRLNRLQNRLDMLYVNPFTGDSRLIYTDKNKRYIGESVLDNIIFLNDDKHFVAMSEQDGYNHLYLYDRYGVMVRDLTKGEFDVTEYYGYDPKYKQFFYQAAAKSPLRREVYSVNFDGTKTSVVEGEEGTSRVDFSSGFKYYVNYFNNINTPNRVTLHDRRGKLIRTLEDNSELKAKLADYSIPEKEFFSFTTSEGVDLNGYIIKPVDFDESKAYPLLMTQYSGPNSQSVKDTYGKSWLDYLASNGYVVACVDGRGTGARGEEFRKCTYRELGKYESDDQIEAAKYLGSLNYIDSSNIAIWGWSYGGYMSTLCLAKGGDTFKAAVAVAPVTNWRYYDSVYTERYMRTPQENPHGYDDNSPINHASKITGKLLLVHGSADDNVHFHNSTELAEVLVQANVQFEMMFYTNRNHSIYGGNTRTHLYNMVVNFLDRNLK